MRKLRGRQDKAGRADPVFVPFLSQTAQKSSLVGERRHRSIIAASPAKPASGDLRQSQLRCATRPINHVYRIANLWFRRGPANLLYGRS